MSTLNIKEGENQKHHAFPTLNLSMASFFYKSFLNHQLTEPQGDR